MESYEYHDIYGQLKEKSPNECETLCAFTVDVEDWYQSSVDYHAPITKNVVHNVNRVLAILDENEVKATFFVQGLIAEKFPSLIKQLVANGHEIQSHGYSHKPLNEMNRQELRDELERSRKSIEDVCGKEVTTFRAPDFTIFSENLWALEVLREVGFEIDTSIFPLRTRRYGIKNWSISPHRIQLPNGDDILEIPVAIWARFGFRIPVAGGGYFRLLPYFFLEHAIASILSDSRPVIIYCHPYEFNPDELDSYRGKTPPLFRFQQGLGREYFAKRANKLLQHFSFGRFDQVLKSWNLI